MLYLYFGNCLPIVNQWICSCSEYYSDLKYNCYYFPLMFALGRCFSSLANARRKPATSLKLADCNYYLCDVWSIVPFKINIRKFGFLCKDKEHSPRVACERTTFVNNIIILWGNRYFKTNYWCRVTLAWSGSRDVAVRGPSQDRLTP